MSDPLEARIAALEAELRRLAARVEALSAWEAARAPILARHAEPPAAAALPAEAVLEAAEFISFGDGFHTLETLPDGTPCRWTGASARATFWVDRSRPLQLAAEVVSRGRLPPEAPPILEVEGLRLPLLREGEGRRHRAGPIPPRPGTGPTEIALHIPHPFRPSDYGEADRRLLGIQIARLSLGPLP
ncbi:MAG: hypothetical protein NZM27_13895 [Acetobacteraceae bacterium]|nr:hypothetical protein [Acetobacteraceae bacterium]